MRDADLEARHAALCRRYAAARWENRQLKRQLLREARINNDLAVQLRRAHARAGRRGQAADQVS